MACANPACSMAAKDHPNEICKSYINPSTKNIVISCLWDGCTANVKRKDLDSHFIEAHGVSGKEPEITE